MNRAIDPSLDDSAPHTDGVFVADRIRSAMAEASPAERRVARALLSKYPTAGLESTARLAEQAGASAPTVVRFISRLGVGGYRDFQQLLRDEVQQRRASPVTQVARLGTDSSSRDLQVVSSEIFEREISGTVSALPLVELEQTIDLLAHPRNRVTQVGGRYSYLLAEYLHLHVRVMRKDSRHHRTSAHADAPLLLDATPRDVFVIFDFRRYQRDTVDLAQRLHDRGCKIVLITDPWLSPISAFADAVLPVRVEGPSPFDSLVSAMALVEIIIAGLHARLGDSAAQRIHIADELSDDPSLL